MAKEKENETKTVPTVWKKAKIDYHNLKIGGTVEGVFRGVKKVGERTNKQTAEVTDRCVCVLQRENSDEKFQINHTAGLKNALDNSEVKEGDYIRIDRLEKTTLKDGVTQCNQYDIFTRG